MEQFPQMLWLAALMGLLAACAFSFLFFLAFRRPRKDAVGTEDSAPAVEDNAALFVTDRSPDTASVGDLDGGPDPMVLRDDATSEEDEAIDTNAPGPSDWFAISDSTPEFDDFDPREDDLVVVWDDATGPEPRVQVRRSEDDPALSHVLMGDVIVAQFRTRANVDYQHVSLMPVSMARTLGWAHA